MKLGHASACSVVRDEMYEYHLVSVCDHFRLCSIYVRGVRVNITFSSDRVLFPLCESLNQLTAYRSLTVKLTEPLLITTSVILPSTPMF